MTTTYTRLALAARFTLPASAAALALLAASHAQAREYFVSGAGTDTNNNDGTLAKPFRTLQKAANLTVPGDIVTALNGVYTGTGGAVLSIKRSGAANAWIKYRAYPGHTPKVKFTGWNGISVSSGASYIEITGFEVEGSIKDTTLAYCQSKKDVAEALCNGNGISIMGREDGPNKPHHIRVAENDVHHSAGAGLSAIAADYITFEDNLVHENAWYTRYGASGISILTPWQFDQSTGYKLIVRRNRAWNNRTLVPWEAIGKLSDGNGIIIDTTNVKNTYGEFKGRILVSNNVSFNNGGSGIHSFQGAHVDILNNTAYHNGQVVGYPDIYAGYSQDVKLLNNVAYSRPGGKANSNGNNTNVTYDYNIYYNGTVAVKGPHDLTVDPGFVHASTNPDLADFQLKVGSPGIDSGLTQSLVKDDIDGAPRPQGAAYDRGAYEHTPAPDLLTNGGFEAGDFSGWFIYQNTSLVTTSPIQGKYTARAGTPTAGGGGEQQATITPGKKYTLRATGRLEQGNYGVINYTFRDAQNHDIGADLALPLFNAVTAERSTSFVAPANAVKLIVSFWTSAGGLLHVDGLSLVAD